MFTSLRIYKPLIYINKRATKKAQLNIHFSDRLLTLAASRAVVPVAREAALAVPTSRSRATQTTLGERVAGGASGSWTTFTPSTALTAGKT